LRGDELRVVLANGAEALFRSAEDPERLRGPNASWAWIDEGALCPPGTWTVAIGRLRQHGVAGPCWVTTTPKPRNVGGTGENWTRRVFVTDATDETALYRAATADNPFLPAEFARSLRSQYTARLARQELDAEWNLDVDGALFTRAAIEASEVRRCPPLARIVVGVDPAVTSGPDADLTGIVVAGLGEDGRGYVLWSGGVRMTPDGWARRVVALYHEFGADAIVAEANQGGDLVSTVLRTVDRTVPVRLVRATRGKRTRAEPIAALWEQGRVSLLVSDTIHA
jgi:phage terminase large subunit-like protein